MIRKHSFRLLFVFVLLFSNVANMSTATAQCAMCSLNAENSTQDGNTQGKGLNDGILFLLAMPFLIAAGVGLLWYKKFRQTNQSNSLTVVKGVEE
ncbi:hypothetical protein GQF61_11385 [Sphingobacterium sp. DK4209]|uniref:LPXTG cell wall anchor domain-containing protein n=1 Tax=Sphingobacterium zhuxiongii TaxID=2662364 RepID=A0A5Q0QDM1_9SPHI|nr:MULTISPECIES: hypothetical protein [unclassified Sphingobacterium]MVZ66462.1 hypothetical protein [Sphingobacterium sp. DK4209]QGA27309.1 hypothetical protein GFH32_13755 [Sphingobacterium sp. dk4302]